MQHLEKNSLYGLLTTHLPDAVYYKATYSKDDQYTIIEPSIDPCIHFTDFLFYATGVKRAIVLDEHGKLVMTMIVKRYSLYDENHEEVRKIVYNDLANKTKTLECNGAFTPEYLVEDYKLKKIIARLIQILGDYGAKPIKEHRGSLHINHLLWMLNEIYSTKKPMGKRHNWLGFVQAALVSKNIIDIQHERDIMYHIF